MEYRITYTYKTQAEAKSDEVEEFASEIATDVTEMHLFPSELFTLEKVEEIKVETCSVCGQPDNCGDCTHE